MGRSVELPTVLLTVEIQVGFSSVPMGLPEKNVLSPVYNVVGAVKSFF